jgi:hypothetical protein
VVAELCQPPSPLHPDLNLAVFAKSLWNKVSLGASYFTISTTKVSGKTLKSTSSAKEALFFEKSII